VRLASQFGITETLKATLGPPLGDIFEGDSQSRGRRLRIFDPP
jgi:hypothetical protein